MSADRHTFCRICEPACPMIATVDNDGKVIALRSDPYDPIGGTPCHKGLAFLEVHNDPDRLDWPRKRLNPKSEPRGEFVDTRWDTAIDEISKRIKEITSTYGPNAVAVFSGNPFAFNSAAFMLSGAFTTELGTQMRFSVNTQDAASRPAAAAAVFGSESALFVPDLYNTQYLLCVGSNPKVSRWTMMSTPNDPDVLQAIIRRGGKIRFVNPRTIESSTEETGETVRIRPGTDVYFLAALLCVIHEIGRFKNDLLRQYASNVDSLIAFVSRFPPESVESVTGVSAETMREIAEEFSCADSAVAYSATGLNQSGQGVLGAWLIDMLNLVTGNLGRKGGAIKPAGLSPELSGVNGHQAIPTSIGTFYLPDPIGFGCLPAVVLPDLIEAGDIRALINLGGNPLLSIGGETRLRAAFEKLDLLVSIDIYPSVTAEMSDFALPGADWLERPDVNLVGAFGMQTFPHVRYTKAMASPRKGRRNDWWILARLAQALGLTSPLDDDPNENEGIPILEDSLAASGLSVDALLDAPGQVLRIPDLPADSLFQRCVKHSTGRIDCYPAIFETWGLIERCNKHFTDRLTESPETMRLISLRTPQMHNSWLSNSETLRAGRHALAPLALCQSDATRLGLCNGDAVLVSSDAGQLETRVFIDDGLLPGTAAMSHGFGHRHAYGLSVAQRSPGANYNILSPTGLGTFEPLSNMSLMSGFRVQIERLQEK